MIVRHSTDASGVCDRNPEALLLGSGVWGYSSGNEGRP